MWGVGSDISFSKRLALSQLRWRTKVFPNTTPKSRTISVSQGNETGVYAADEKGVVYKLTFDRNTSTEQSSILNPNILDPQKPLKRIIPPDLLKIMRIQLYKTNM